MNRVNISKTIESILTSNVIESPNPKKKNIPSFLEQRRKAIRENPCLTDVDDRMWKLLFNYWNNQFHTSYLIQNERGDDVEKTLVHLGLRHKRLSFILSRRLTDHIKQWYKK